MPVDLIPCGDYANDSERRAAEKLHEGLRKHGGNDRWVLLSNVAHSVSPQSGLSEIDLIAVGPTGLFVIEVKHWAGDSLKQRPAVVEKEAVKLDGKVKKVKSRLPLDLQEQLGFLAGSFLLTADDKPLGGRSRPNQNTCKFYSLGEWKELLDLDGTAKLRDIDVARVVAAVEPRAKASMDGSLRQIDGFRDLSLLTPPGERFHRVFRARDARRGRVILHLYDLSAHAGDSAERVARRESEALQSLQASPAVPRVIETFREVVGYPGELFLFATSDPAAPPLSERRADGSWTPMQRLRFAGRAFEALAGLQKIAAASKSAVAHRNITPETLLVAAGDEPLLVGFHLAKFPGSVTVAPGDGLAGSAFLPPELGAGSAAAADFRSDLYSLTKTIRTLFVDLPPLPSEADDALTEAESVEASRRPSAASVAQRLRVAAGDAVPATPPARFWSEEQVVRFRGQAYRLVSRLGTGGFGTTYRVVELDDAGEDVGEFVAKVVPDQEAGERALRAIQRVRPHSDHPNLALIHERAEAWRDNEFIALMKYVPGEPLADYAGIIALYAEEAGTGEEQLLLAWAAQLCDALARLHGAGLVHGDVSLGNVIVNGGKAVLTDFDTVLKTGEPRQLVGTRGYQPPEAAVGNPAAASHDVFALAAVLFHAANDRPPFDHGGEFRPDLGCRWDDDQGAARWPTFRRFVGKATSTEEVNRFASAAEAVAFLRTPPLPPEPPPVPAPSLGDAEPQPAPPQVVEPTSSVLTPNEVPWLRQVLQAYPGGRYGNAETRGLDSEFAANTYVETDLDRALMEDVRGRRTQLVILCGNAGDGKTALLQHLFDALGLPPKGSAQRLRDERLADGLHLRVNLDGSAAFAGRSADELMDELLLPFLTGVPADDVCHLLAVNDGRLLEWIEGCVDRHGEAWLTTTLVSLLDGESAEEQGVRFINLNARSLVGGAADASDDFLADLIDRMLAGPGGAEATWGPCHTCVARDRCRVRRTVDDLCSPGGDMIRRRLRQALQGVHQRGEVHITARELRGTLSYVLFGTSYCTELHEAGELPRYPHLSFDAESELRQGELLGELARLDPALDAQPRIDRYLRRDLIIAAGTGDNANRGDVARQLAAARRRAFFTWDEAEHAAAGTGDERIALHGGRHLLRFRQVATMDDSDRRAVCERLCRGISRLEDLPSKVLDRAGRVLIKVTPRTPIESAFWIEKPADRFDLLPEELSPAAGADVLHRHLRLRYHYQDGRREPETLRLNSELFHLLLELADGFQISDLASDATFAHLSIFTQRLAQEEERSLFAWTPADEEVIYEVRPEMVHEARRLGLYRVADEATGGETEFAMRKGGDVDA